ncbi:helix-turn-helix domain-containing protein [Roseomonas terrae]|uniref:Helix-turn-helix domain-containing protein n=1 Tax=Neoroseomonas terrae TaxID=424799 RepID=A0ABS5ELV4_9PROT|nr:helix-turn-helix domain-containing protein [Neoroseomonas terrae]MBR0651994.1 helix-turn-helix domain-containing protein [Neoroseomonas terrae]
MNFDPSAQNIQPNTALGFRVNDACRLGGFGRTTCYALLKNGALKKVKVAGRTLIEGDSLRALLKNGSAEISSPAK